MYTIYRRTENDELTEVAAVEDRAQAERLMYSLKNLWPADYEVRESEPAE